MSAKKSVLLITDIAPNGSHSAIDGIYKSSLKTMYNTHIVYIGKEVEQPQILDDGIIWLPYSARKKQLEKLISTVIDLNTVDYLITRNLFSCLTQIHEFKHKYKFQVGFWESFPHSYRRVHQAHEEKKAILRKKVEYFFKSRREGKLLQDCDFYFPITETFKTTFREKVTTPYLAMPMGINFDTLPKRNPDITSKCLKFVYIGTIDSLRQLDKVLECFHEIQGDFELHIYSKSQNSAVDKLKSYQDQRIIFHDALPRDQLLQALASYDVGVSIIPPGKLYDVSSPTKTYEYAAMGLAVLINPLPEHAAVFSSDSCISCEFDQASIKSAIEKTLVMTRNKIARIAANGKQVVKEKRNYQHSSEALHNFLEGLTNA